MKEGISPPARFFGDPVNVSCSLTITKQIEDIFNPDLTVTNII